MIKSTVTEIQTRIYFYLVLSRNVTLKFMIGEKRKKKIKKYDLWQNILNDIYI